MGWGQIKGSGAISTTDTVTLPTAYTTILGVQVTMLGYKASATAATDITDLTGTFNISLNANPYDITTSNFKVEMARASGTMSTNVWFAYSWMAWGI